MRRHWFHCTLCGARFRSYAAEARHRHNAPFLCRPRTRAQREAVAQASAHRPAVRTLLAKA